MENDLNLKGRMDDWGPYGRQEGRTIVFSIGNPNEGHGPALPRDNDSRCANYVAYNVCERTGARFVAHIPFTTDRVGEIARDWSPGYMPMDECVERSVAFVKQHCEALLSRGIAFDRVAVIVGHGGNNGIEAYGEWGELRDELGIEGIGFHGTIKVDLGRLLRLLEPFSEAERQSYLGVKGGHADTVEHSIATLYNGLDYGRVTEINQHIKKRGMDETLKKWPVLGGLGGYLKFGGERYEPLRKVAGLVECLAKFEEDGQIFVYPRLARLLMEGSIDATARAIRPAEGD
ncbi:MAG: creatininase family protein [Candidatus Lokiarchaeota archaeon]|nr:creatininase family protein [Candidatus Lokiarchaeota archaeon]